MIKLALIGQQDFGKAVLEAFIARGDQVAGVFCKPEGPSERPDSLRLAAQALGIPIYQFASLKSPEAEQARRLYCNLPLKPSSTFQRTARFNTILPFYPNTEAPLPSVGLLPWARLKPA